jgi:hypothetical protein
MHCIPRFCWEIQAADRAALGYAGRSSNHEHHFILHTYFAFSNGVVSSIPIDEWSRRDVVW